MLVGGKVREDQNYDWGLILPGSRDAPTSPYNTWFLRVRYFLLSTPDEWMLVKGWDVLERLSYGGYERSIRLGG